jgi:hypothetical protein
MEIYSHAGVGGEPGARGSGECISPSDSSRVATFAKFFSCWRQMYGMISLSSTEAGRGDDVDREGSRDAVTA